MARPASRIPSPLSAALERLARLSGTGTAASRMGREAGKIVEEWRADPALDAAGLRERLEAFRDDLAGGVAQAEEALGDIDGSDKGAVRQATATLDGLRAAHDAAVAELGG